ncbi:MAG: prephenate dehydrogenase [Candidatus Daviesbacteria bacterium]|nr:prephenate dehydrogenase [Candidatus Daviesbacteria bacterium]
MQIEEVGIIGTGDMGTLEAKAWAKAGFSVSCYDLPQNRDRLERDLAGTGINILDDAIAVVRRSDLTRLLVPVEKIDESVSEWGPSVKKHALVSSGTSVMTPAITSFERRLPQDVHIINWHMLAGPSVPPPNMDSALVRYRSTDVVYQGMRDAIGQIGPKIIELDSYQTHDKITADTQAVTHVGFEAMGTAWKNMGRYPWENPTYVGGIDNVKVLMMLRIYGGKPHVYSGLALHNPYAGEQIRQYSNSVSELFSLMIQEEEQDFRERIMRAGENIFSDIGSPILLDDKIMGEFGLGSIPTEHREPNPETSLLAMVDAWDRAKINPYHNMICQTPVFRLRLGIVESVFRNKDFLEESIEAAFKAKSIRRDELEFHTAVREWATIVGSGSPIAYHRQFEETQRFFADRITEGMKKSGELINQLSKA